MSTELIPSESNNSLQEPAISFNVEEIREVAKANLDFFAALLLPDIIAYDFPPLYHELFRRIVDGLENTSKLLRLAFALPRGHAKSTFIRIIVAWLIIYSNSKSIVIFSASQNLARKAVADIVGILNSYNVRTVYGDWTENLERDTQDSKKFTFNGRSIILEACGAGTAVRGLLENFVRPDVLIFDDAQTASCAASKAESKSFQEWFVGSALKLVDPNSPCIVVYIGNMYKDVVLEQSNGINVYCCVLRNLQRSPSWFTIVVGAILSSTEVLWKEKRSLESLKEEYQNDKSLGKLDIFMAEVQNDPEAKTKSFLDLETIKPYDISYGDLCLGNYIIVDPATSKLTPDLIVINYFEIYNHLPVSVEILANKQTSFQTCVDILKLAEEKRCKFIFIESNGYQYELCTWLQQICKIHNINNLEIVDFYSSKNKTQRIVKFFYSWVAGEIHTTHKTHSLVKHQAVAFDIAKTDNLDDIVDSMDMGLRIHREYKDVIIQGYNDYYNTADNDVSTLGINVKQITSF